MKNKKIVIDKRKLDTLIRLGCPDSALIETIKTGKAKKTGDALIDDYLQTFFAVKTFSDKWGGNHNPTGKNQINSKDYSGQLDLQDEGQLDSQVVDIDKDKDINKDSLKNKRGAGGKEKLSLEAIAGDSALIDPFRRFLEYRKEIKKPFKSMMSVKSAFKKLSDLSFGSLPDAEAIVEQSIANGWQGLFPLKDESKTNKPKSMAELYAEATNW